MSAPESDDAPGATGYGRPIHQSRDTRKLP
jgi:hypothetical protein